MTRRLVLAGALVAAGCTPTPHHGAGLIHLHATPISTTTSSSSTLDAPSAARPVQTRASRNARRRTPATTGPLPAAGNNLAGVHVTSTAYCETGRTANGQHPYWGSAAANRWPFGTRLHIVELGRDVTINDRIGSGSDLDIAYPGDCPAAVRYGRRTVTVQIVAA